NELTGNIDAYRLSTYLHKNRGGLLKMGPLWDLNIGYGKQDRVPVTDWIANYNSHVDRDPWMVPFWWTRLLEDPLFRLTVKNQWQEFRQGALSTSAVLEKVDATANLLIDNGLIDRNYSRWTGISVDYLQSINELKNYLSNRLEWMDATIQAF
ncbi:MAG: CotH kinase family protein, partial [Flavobacteriaceae bacterium]